MAQALCAAGIVAVDGRDFLDRIPCVGGTVEDVAQGRTLVAWDVDYMDPMAFPLQDHRGVLVIRISDIVPWQTLVRRIVQLVCSLRDEGTPKEVLVLEFVTPGPPAKSSVGKPKAAA